LIRVPRGACPAEGLHVQPQPIEAIIAASAAGRIFQLAYHRDRKPWRAAYSGPCRVARDFEEVTWPNIQPDFLAAEDLVLHTCDTSDASSGSPLFMETDGEPVVVALSVGTYEQTTEPAPKDSPRLHKGFAVANSAVNAAAFADKIAWLAAAKILSRRSDLRILQERLRDLKLYDGRIDGTFGSTLSAAIEAYERAHRTSVTGLPTRQLMHRLAEDIRRHGQVTPSTDVLEPAR